MRAFRPAFRSALAAALCSVLLAGCSDSPSAGVDMTGFRKADPALTQMEAWEKEGQERAVAERELAEAARMGPPTLDEIAARVASEETVAAAAGLSAQAEAKRAAAEQFKAFEREGRSALSEQRQALADGELSAEEKAEIEKSAAGLEADLASASGAYQDWERQFDASEGPALAEAAADELRSGFTEQLAQDAVFESALLADADWGANASAAASFGPEPLSSASSSSASGGNSLLYWWMLSSMMSGPSHHHHYYAQGPSRSSLSSGYSPLRAARAAVKQRSAERKFFSERALASQSSAYAPVAAAGAGAALSAKALAARPSAPPPARLIAAAQARPAQASAAARSPLYKKTGALAANSKGLANLQSKLGALRSGSLASTKRQIALRPAVRAERERSREAAAAASWSSGQSSASSARSSGRLVGRSDPGRGSAYSPARKSPSPARSSSSRSSSRSSRR